MQALGSIHGVFDLSKLPDDLLNHLDNIQDIRKHKSRDRRRDIKARRHNQKSRCEDEDVSYQVEPDGQPALIRKGEKVSTVHVVDCILEFMYENILKTVGADRGDSGQGLAKAGEDDGLEDRLVAFDFAGRGAIIGTVEKKEKEEGPKGDCELTMSC